MHKFLVRAASGIVYAAVIIFCITYGGWALWALAIAFTVIGVCELDHMSIGFSRKTLPYIIIDVIGTISLFFEDISNWFFYMWACSIISRFLFVRRLASKEERLHNSFNYPQIYLGIPFACMLAEPIHRLPLLIFVMLWLNDSGAYIVGSLIGRTKLCPSISPNKTWEGFFGGVAITLIGTYFLQRFCSGFFGMENYSLAIWMILAASTCIFGTIGDLIESKYKRMFGVKDSGHWIPGHGGILDRIDSFLLAFPIAFLILLFINR